MLRRRTSSLFDDIFGHLRGMVRSLAAEIALVKAKENPLAVGRT
jgi:hypothetical protein